MLPSMPRSLKAIPESTQRAIIKHLEAGRSGVEIAKLMKLRDRIQVSVVKAAWLAGLARARANTLTVKPLQAATVPAPTPAPTLLEPAQAPKVTRKASILKQYRNAIRKQISVKDRAKGLVQLTRSKSDQVRMRAYERIDQIDGVLDEAKEPEMPGPIFILPETSFIDMRPVTPEEEERGDS